MSTREDIQSSINSAVSAREGWNAELMKLNASLVSAKGTQKTRIKRAIKNAEDQIKDLDRSIAKLTNDLRRVSIGDTKAEAKLELAKQGISSSSQIVASVVDGAKSVVGSIYGIDGSLPTTDKTKKSKAELNEQSEDGLAKYLKAPYLYYIVGAIVLILLMKKK